MKIKKNVFAQIILVDFEVESNGLFKKFFNKVSR
jgi:hypothetical protein